MVKIRTYIGFCVYRRSYLVWPPAIITVAENFSCREISHGRSYSRSHYNLGARIFRLVGCSGSLVPVGVTLVPHGVVCYLARIHRYPGYMACSQDPKATNAGVGTPMHV